MQKKKNVSGIQFFDTWYNYFARLAKTNNKILANKVCVIDQHAYTEAYEEGVKKEVLHIVGQPALEKLEYKKKSRNNSLLFVNQPISRHEQLNFLNYNEKDFWKIVFDAMEEIRDGYKNFYFGKHPDGDYTSLPNKIFKKLDKLV